jgi:hypothetical protein
VSNNASTNAITYAYTSQLESATSVEQAFTFFDQKTSGNFSDLTFDISASSIKWSIHLLRAANNSSTSTLAAAAGGGLTLSYRLTGLMMTGNVRFHQHNEHHELDCDNHGGAGGAVRCGVRRRHSLRAHRPLHR